MAVVTELLPGQGRVLSHTPYLIKLWKGITTNSIGIEITHGEAGVPDMVVPVQTSSNPTSNGFSVTSKTETLITIDCEDDGNDTFEVFAIWFEQACGGIS